MPIRISTTPCAAIPYNPSMCGDFFLEGDASRHILTRQDRNYLNTTPSSIVRAVQSSRKFVSGFLPTRHPFLLQDPSHSSSSISHFSSWPLLTYLTNSLNCKPARAPLDTHTFSAPPIGCWSPVPQRVLRPFRLPVPARCTQTSSDLPAPGEVKRTSIWLELGLYTCLNSSFSLNAASVRQYTGPCARTMDAPVAITEEVAEGSEICLMGEIPSAELCPSTSNCVSAEELGGIEGLARWLTDRLPGGAVQLASWSESAATKRVANLWTELVEGEISLEDCRPPKRTVHVASVLIRNDFGGLLMESHQEMANGAVRPRNRPLSEKMKPGEQVAEACLRGIAEELGPTLGSRERVTVLGETYVREEEERESFSYPGLLTRYVVHSMAAHVADLPRGSFSTEENEYGSLDTSGGMSEGHECIHERLTGWEARGVACTTPRETLGDGEVLVEGSLGQSGRGCLTKERAAVCTCAIGGVGAGAGAGAGATLEAAVGVKKHFWVWRPPGDLA